MLVNFRVDPQVVQRQLPAPFRPKLQRGDAVAGVCLIRLEEIRPNHIPAALGIASENAAHRIAVVWDDEGREREGVYIPRRDSDSLLNHLAGGRLFPGEHHRARFEVRDDGDRIELRMRSLDDAVSVDVAATSSAELPPGSCFESMDAASRFFQAGSLGYSAKAACDRFDGIELATPSWSVSPLAIERVHSSYFADESRFPPGSVELDCALLMRDIEHEWIGVPDLRAR